MQVDDVLSAIQTGDLDGHLDAVVAAMIERVRSGSVEIMWQLTLDGDTWTQETVTLGELRFAEQHAYVTDPNGRKRRATRVEIDPRVTAEHAFALIVAHLHKAQGVRLDDALKRAGEITSADLDVIVGEYEVVRPPKDDSPASISSSSTA